MKAPFFPKHSESGVDNTGGPTWNALAPFLRTLFFGICVWAFSFCSFSQLSWSNPPQKPSVTRTQPTAHSQPQALSDRDRDVILHLRILLYMDMLEKLTLFEYLDLYRTLQMPAPDAAPSGPQEGQKQLYFHQQNQTLWPSPMAQSPKK
ncbi:MAG: hypothetical protein EP343_10975 [Deltaproteobacteria bacterium]|nr:MAG: hypothetical protein EP343_10975 [Deltaproteobacteria bacterium]